MPVNDIPDDRKIFLRDIIEDGETDLQKSYTIDSNYFKGGKKTEHPLNQSQRRNMVSILQRGRGFNKGGIIEGEKSTTLSSNSWHHNNFIITHSLQPRNGKGSGGKGPLKKRDGKSYCLDTANGQAIEYSGEKRKLTVKECCRLQTVPDNYFEGIVSDTQAYKMLGNGWTIDIIAFIFSFMKSINHATTGNKG
jgi:site-specific DNA-cytosine methylase